MREEYAKIAARPKGQYHAFVSKRYSYIAHYTARPTHSLANASVR